MYCLSMVQRSESEGWDSRPWDRPSGLLLKEESELCSSFRSHSIGLSEEFAHNISQLRKHDM